MTNPASPPPPPPSNFSPPPPSGGMPGWLKILLVVLLVLILGCGCGFAGCYFMCQRAAQKAGVSLDFTGTGVSLPENFPSDVPVYSGFKANFVVAPPGTNGGTVTFTGTGAPSDIASFYDTQLTGKGWKQVTANASGDSRTETYSKDDQNVNFSATTGGGKTTLTITYGKK